jgi:CHAT domain-containing protein
MTTLVRMSNITRKYGPRAAVMLITPVVLVLGYLWWTGEIRIGEGTSDGNRPPKPIRANPSPHRELLVFLQNDLEQQLELLRGEVARLRVEAPVSRADLGTALLQLGDLERAVGDVNTGRAALCEVVELHRNVGHWQVGDAARRLEDVRVLAEREPGHQERWREASKRQREAEVLHAQGKFLKGVAAAEEALKLRREVWERTVGNEKERQDESGTARLVVRPTAEHPEVAESLVRLAWLSTEHADCYLRSRELAQEAADATQGAVGEDHPMYGDCLFVLATLADDRGDFREADRLYDDALAVYKDSIGDYSRAYARVLSRQGRMYDTWCKEYARLKLEQALSLRQQTLAPQDPDCAESLEFLAQSQYAVRAFSQAERLLTRALDMRRMRQGPEHPDLAWPQSLLGVCLAMRGDSSQASLYAADALALVEQARGAKHPITCEVRFRMAMAKTYGISDYLGSLHELQTLESDLRELGLARHPDCCRAMHWQGANLFFSTQDRLDSGAPPSDPYWIQLFAALDRVQEALDAYLALPRGAQIGDCVAAMLRLHMINFRTNYARIDADHVRELLTQVERIVNSQGGPLHPFYPRLLGAQAEFLRTQGDIAGAVLKSRESLRSHGDRWGASNPWEYTDCASHLVGQLMHEGSPDSLRQAIEVINRTLDVRLGLYQQDAPGQSDSARLAMLKDAFDYPNVALSIAETPEQFAAAYDRFLVLKGSASSFQNRDRLANDHSNLAGLAGLREAARQARHVLKNVAFTENAAAGSGSNRLSKASDEREHAENRWALATRDVVRAESPVTWKDLQQVLPKGAAFIDFLQYNRAAPSLDRRGAMLRDPSIAAFIVTKSHPPIHVDLGFSRPIRAAVTAWRKAIGASQATRTVRMDRAVDDLANLVWRPLQPHLHDLDSLIISPDGPLCFVSFAALPGRRPGSYALEDFAIHYASSGRWLRRQLQDQSATEGQGLLLCGDIQYQPGDHDQSPQRKSSSDLLPDVDRVPNLPASRLEIAAVNQLFETHIVNDRRNMILAGTAATAPQLTAELERNWRFVHFAGHGLFIPPALAQALTGDIPLAGRSNTPDLAEQVTYSARRNQLLLSGLVLAPDLPTMKKPGFLTAEELGSFDLRETDLVVLSACETGIGCTAGGDGVLGLTRAFLTAGARSVVSSLWKVDDAATTCLMKEFYCNLWERGLSKSESLRRAQLALLRDPNLIYKQQTDLLAQLQQSHPDLDRKALRDLLAQRGLVAGETARVVAEPPDDYEEPQPESADSSHAPRTPPVYWAAFILNGDAR